MSDRTQAIHRIGFLFTVAAAAPLSVHAQVDDTAGPALPTVVVSATRSEEDLSTVPASVTVIDREQIEAQSRTARTLAEVLGKLVPGLALGVGSQTNTSQTLRGRGLLVLIDGIPQTTIRNASRDLYTIDPSAVERIEIIRGASAMYGQGGAGGVVNIITRAPAPGEASYSSSVGMSSSLTHASDEGLGGHLRQFASARSGDVYYLLSAALEHVGGAYDADSERIAPDPSQGDLYDTSSFNLLGKLGWVRDDQRLELVANRFRSRQDTDFVSDPSVNVLPPGSVPARALRGLQLEQQGETENDVLSLGYRHADLGGSSVDAQLYHRDYYTRFFPFDGRPFAAWNSIAQSYVESEVTGARLAIDTPLFATDDALSLLWGVDLSEETTAQRAATFDPQAFDATRGLVFVPVADRGLVPPLRHRQLGAFAQLEWTPGERWTLRGGARHERVELHVDDFVTLGQGHQIPGGTVDYSSTVANVGAVFDASDEVQLYAAYSEGFSLPDIGLILRGASPGFDVSRSSLEPIEVQDHEIGVRGDWRDLQGSLSLFYSRSDLGVTSNGFSANVVRSPERTYGAEIAVDAWIGENLMVGGSFTWIEGENDPGRTGDYVALNGWRIPPTKFVAYLEHATLPGWTNRLQLVHSGDRDRAADAGVGYGGRAVESFSVVDLLSTVDVGPGQLGIGVENLFNEDYHNVYAQLLVNSRNETHFKAPGRTLRLDYTIAY